MIGSLLGRIAAIWRRAVLSGDGRRRGEIGHIRSGETQTMTGPGPATLPTPREADAARAAIAAGDRLACAMASLGIEPLSFAEREANWLRDMRRTCRTCDARSRCRRDAGGGDFARRYRHYCPNAGDLARIAAWQAAKARAAEARTRGSTWRA